MWQSQKCLHLRRWITSAALAAPLFASRAFEVRRCRRPFGLSRASSVGIDNSQRGKPSGCLGTKKKKRKKSVTRGRVGTASAFVFGFAIT